MKRTALPLTFVFVLLFATVPVSAQDDADAFFGRWSLYLPGGAGWLNVHDDAGYLDAELLWYGGSVLPVAHAYITDGTLVVTRVGPVKQDDGRTHHVTQRFEFQAAFHELVGRAYMPDRNGMGQSIVAFRGKRLPPLPPAPDLARARFGEPIQLFNGKDLTGWRLINPEHKNGWRVEDGVLINDPQQPADDPHKYHYGNLRTEDEFEDFNLKLEVNVPEGSNSGVYLRGIYEIQVVDSYGKPLDSHNMGALYSRITPSEAAEKPAGEWQTMDITLYNQHVTVVLNGKKIIDNAPVLGVTGGAMTADEFSPGPIYLQGDHGKVLYRNIVLTPIID